MLNLDSLKRLNATEAYQLCRKLGITVHPAEPRERLLEYLLGLREPMVVTEATHPLDSWRHGLIGFVRDHWDQIQTQLTCPIRSGDWRSCFGCLDMQVVECVVKNPRNENLIQLHKKTS